jgi:hypothetical protein
MPSGFGQTVMAVFDHRLHLLAAPKSPGGQAISNALSNQEALVGYWDNRDLEDGNDGVEHSLREVMVGRKNWMVYG